MRGEFGWAGGLRHAARGGRQAAAAGGSAGAGSFRRSFYRPMSLVLAQVELHVRPVDAVYHGYALGAGSWWRWSVAEPYLPRWAKRTSERRRRRRAAGGEHEDVSMVSMRYKHGVLRREDDVSSR